jgi:endonuclease YncB( thermonuclease family)
MKPEVKKPPQRRTFWHAFCFAVIGGIAAMGIATSFESKAVGPAQRISVIDGDTIQLNGRIVQLYGIDAPELGQTCLNDGNLSRCGLSAAFELQKLLKIEHAPLECQPVKDVGDPALQVCAFGYMDPARILLESGYALANAGAGPEYAKAEDSARQARMGLWHSRYVAPEDWRAGQRLAEETVEAAGPCPIKAVVAPDGQRLYYVPTDSDYNSVEVDSAQGSRLYCSDEDARRDGWRRKGQLGG